MEQKKRNIEDQFPLKSTLLHTIIFFLGTMSKTFFSSQFPLDIGVRESTNLFINSEVLQMYVPI